MSSDTVGSGTVDSGPVGSGPAGSGVDPSLRSERGVLEDDRLDDRVDATAGREAKHVDAFPGDVRQEGRALRVETVINSPTDLRVGRRLRHLDELQDKARAINTRLLDTERVGQGCVLARPAFARVAHPTVEEGRRAPALRFGDPRVMALTGALCATLHAVTGITNKSLRALMTGLLDVPYSIGQASYDLRRLRLKGLIRRLPHSTS